MAQIMVGIVNPTETEKTTVQVPDNVPVADVIEALVDVMGLPLRGQDGRRLRYHLSMRESRGELERLDHSQSLQGNRIGENGVLQLSVEMVAGSALRRHATLRGQSHRI